jgi:hypothetical protein
MRHFLHALMLVVVALILSLTAGKASAMRHEQTVALVVAALQDVDADSDCQHDGCHDGKCLYPCCSAAGVAVLPVPVANNPRTARPGALGLPGDSWRDGITVHPDPGPPKLSV